MLHSTSNSSRGKVQVIVEDRGRGFDPENIPPGHYGLVGIERARPPPGWRGPHPEQPG